MDLGSFFRANLRSPPAREMRLMCWGDASAGKGFVDLVFFFTINPYLEGAVLQYG